jgi:hypothetical protein
LYNNNNYNNNNNKINFKNEKIKIMKFNLDLFRLCDECYYNKIKYKIIKYFSKKINILNSEKIYFILIGSPDKSRRNLKTYSFCEPDYFGFIKFLKLYGKVKIIFYHHFNSENLNDYLHNELKQDYKYFKNNEVYSIFKKFNQIQKKNLLE